MADLGQCQTCQNLARHKCHKCGNGTCGFCQGYFYANWAKPPVLCRRCNNELHNQLQCQGRPGEDPVQRPPKEGT